MKLNRFSASLGVIAALAIGVAAGHADYTVIDGNSGKQTFKSYLSGLVHWPAHIMGGLFGGVPTPVNMTNSGQLDVNCITGCTGGGGAATAANQATANTSLASLVTNTTGVSTAANQVTGNNALGSIQAGVGAPSDGAWTTGNGSETALLKTIAGAALDTTTPSMTRPYCGSSCTSGVTAAMTGTTSTSLLAAPSTGNRNYVTQLTCGNSHATVGTFVDLQDGNGGTVFYAIPAGAVFNGAVLSFPSALKQPTLATALYVVDETTGANVKCAASGYTAP